jgi:hypothetical protein
LNERDLIVTASVAFVAVGVRRDPTADATTPPNRQSSQQYL